MPQHKLFVSHGSHSKITEEVIAIEYHDNKPFGVMTRETTDNRDRVWYKPGNEFGVSGLTYDFEWSKTFKQLYWHNSGSGWTQFVVSPFSEPIPAKAKLWLAPRNIRISTRRCRWVAWASNPETRLTRPTVTLNVTTVGTAMITCRIPMEAACANTLSGATNAAGGFTKPKRDIYQSTPMTGSRLNTKSRMTDDQ